MDSGDLTALSIAARVLARQGRFSKRQDRGFRLSQRTSHRTTQSRRSANRYLGSRYQSCHGTRSTGSWRSLQTLSPTRDSRLRVDPKIKLSNSPIKVSNPGRLQIYRCIDPDGCWLADIMSTEPILSSTDIYTLAGEPASIDFQCTLVPLY